MPCDPKQLEAVGGATVEYLISRSGLCRRCTVQTGMNIWLSLLLAALAEDAQTGAATPDDAVNMVRRSIERLVPMFRTLSTCTSAAEMLLVLQAAQHAQTRN